MGVLLSLDRESRGNSYNQEQKNNTRIQYTWYTNTIRSTRRARYNSTQEHKNTRTQISTTTQCNIIIIALLCFHESGVITVLLRVLIDCRPLALHPTSQLYSYYCTRYCCRTSYTLNTFNPPLPPTNFWLSPHRHSSIPLTQGGP